MEKLKFNFEIVKFKITLFTTIIGAGAYLYINKSAFVKEFNPLFFKLICFIIVTYGTIGFVTNILELNDIKRRINED